MSFIPLLLNDQCRLLDQHIGHGMDVDDLLTSIALSKSYERPRRSQARGVSRLDTDSTISMDKDKYQVCLEVHHFSPEEITVKTAGRQVVVEGKHEEKQDEHGDISRYFMRKYQVPEEYNVEDVASSLSSDGVLNIMVPRDQRASLEEERVVPITSTGVNHKNIEHKSEQCSSQVKMNE